MSGSDGGGQIDPTRVGRTDASEVTLVKLALMDLGTERSLVAFELVSRV